MSSTKINEFETTRWMPLIERLAGARGKDIPPVTIKGLNKIFDEMGAKQAELTVSMIEKYENLPSNLLGHIKNIWDELKRRKEHDHLNLNKWKAEEGCTNSDEWDWYFKIIVEIFDWHTKRLVKYNHEGLTGPITITEWKKLGCPKSWCPIHDHFFEGYLRAHDLPGSGCLDYLKQYYTLLVENRKKRTSVKTQNESEG